MALRTHSGLSNYAIFWQTYVGVKVCIFPLMGNWWLHIMHFSWFSRNCFWLRYFLISWKYNVCDATNSMLDILQMYFNVCKCVFQFQWRLPRRLLQVQLSMLLHRANNWCIITTGGSVGGHGATTSQPLCCTTRAFHENECNNNTVISCESHYMLSCAT